MRGALKALDPLLNHPGVFVFGSNDYFGPKPVNPLIYLQGKKRKPSGEKLPWEGMRAAFIERGWRDATHQRLEFKSSDVRLALAGVDGPHHDLDQYDKVAGEPNHDADLSIGLLHAPYRRVLDAFEADGYQLALAGHTHGGQVCLPGWGALTTNCDLDAGRVKGVSRWWPGAGTAARGIPEPDDAAWLEVSAGLGHSPMAPYRFACRPEATLLTLVPEGRDR